MYILFTRVYAHMVACTHILAAKLLKFYRIHKFFYKKSKNIFIFTQKERLSRGKPLF